MKIEIEITNAVEIVNISSGFNTSATEREGNRMMSARIVNNVKSGDLPGWGGGMNLNHCQDNIKM